MVVFHAVVKLVNIQQDLQRKGIASNGLSDFVGYILSIVTSNNPGGVKLF